MKRLVATFLLFVFVASIPLSALDGDKASYFGGTHGPYAGAKEPIEGRLNTYSEDVLVLIPAKRPYFGVDLRIAYSKIIDLEYGQKAGRRVGTAVATTVLLGPIGLVSLFSKKRKHFLTVGYKDDAGKDQVAVIELGKDIVRTTLAIVQTRSGKSIEYQDEDARKSAPTASIPAPVAAAPTAPAISTPPAAAAAPAPVEFPHNLPVVMPDPAAARTALEAGTRAETTKDWKTALQHYQRARALDPSMSVFIDASIARVKEQMGTPSDSDALRRARQYDALGRRAEAITWYERALESLPESDPNRDVVRKRLNELKGAQ